MTLISERPDVFTVVAVLDVPDAHCEAALDLAVRRTEEHIRHLPGFVSASWHLRLPDGIGSDSEPLGGPAGCRRITAYIQWRDRDSFRAFIDDPNHSRHLAQVQEMAVQTSLHPCQVYKVINARADVTTIDPDQDVITGVIRLDTQPGKQGWVLDYNIAETERVIKHLPGFVSANFHLGQDGATVIEYVQWETVEHFSDAYHNPDFYEHIPVIAHYASADLALYRLRRTIVGPDAARVPSLT